MKESKLKSFIKYIVLICLCAVAIYQFFLQQSSLNSYASSEEYYLTKIAEQMEYKESLLELKDNLNSTEYIEKVAREKLDMYLPNERVYVDKN